MLGADSGRRVRAVAAALDEAEGHHAVESSAQVAAAAAATATATDPATPPLPALTPLSFPFSPPIKQHGRSS